jgi:AcrR family transcriptional regulator
VARTADARRPAALLDAIADYLSARGVSEVSLRPLARAVKSSPRVLLYYFGSKEKLVVKALSRLRERQRDAWARQKNANSDKPSDACRVIWQEMSAPAAEPLFRLFLDAYSRALSHRRPFARFLRTAVEDWLDFLAAPLVARGVPEAEARAHATVILSGFRGFLLDYCASRDRKRLDRAVDMWLEALDSLPTVKETTHAR